MDKTARQKISKKTEDLNGTIYQLNLTDIYRTLHPTTAEYTFFSSAYGTFTKIDHVLSHKTNLNTFKRIQVIQSKFSFKRFLLSMMNSQNSTINEPNKN